MKKSTKFLIKRVLTNLSPSYYLTSKHIRETEFLSEKKLLELQLGRLKRMLVHAYKKVSYYKEAFDKAELDPCKFSELPELQEYPFLDKEIYRDNINSLIVSKAVKAFWPSVFTGGTTGAPLQLYRSFSDYGRERAYMEYSYSMLEINPFAKTAYMRGKVEDARGIYHVIGDFGRTLYLSSNNLSDDNMKLYVQLMQDFKPELLYALPSVATVLAEYMDRNGIPPITSIRYAFLPSENLYDFQQKLIERIFRCPIGSMYGHSEHAVFAARCSESTLFHVLPQYGYTELVDDNGYPVTEENRLGEIVSTSFTNRVSPLIRYRTGDYAVYTNEKCPCGRNYKMWKRIQGREQSVAISKNGAYISIGSELLCTLHDKSYGKIKQFQIEQKKAGELEIYISTHNDGDFEDARSYFKSYFAEEFPKMFDVNILLRNDSELLKSTEKYLYFIQHIKTSNIISQG